VRRLDVSDGKRNCTVCKERKPLDDFHRCATSRIGRTSRCKRCAVDVANLWSKNNRERARTTGAGVMRRLRARRRQAILEGYGGKCACCGETEPAFLALDHVGDDGRAHRASLAMNGAREAPNHVVYGDVIKRGFPPTFQLLCHNCNMGKAIKGECPHVTARREQAS
jgi:hypothetical protein